MLHYTAKTLVAKAYEQRKDNYSKQIVFYANTPEGQ